MSDKGPERARKTGKMPAVSSIMDTVVFRLSRLMAINERAGSRWSMRMFGLSLNEWRVMGVTQAHRPARAGQVADILMMDKSQLSRLIKGLTDKGYLISSTSAQDARAVELTLTDEGVALHDRFLAEAVQRNENMLAALDAAEVRIFIDMLERLTADNLDVLRRKGSGPVPED